MLVSAVLISVWFIAYGGGRPRTRQWIVRARLAGVRGVDGRDEAGLQRRHGHLPLDAAVRAPIRINRSATISGDAEATDWQTTPHDYPRFLGTGYWAEVTGVELETDWKAHPPQEVWRHEIGAGWSAFAIVGNYAVTQEQRGDEELVSCYRVDNGELVWTHSDPARFDPADFQGGLGGIGPRATPTIHDGKVLTQGATGHRQLPRRADRQGDLVARHGGRDRRRRDRFGARAVRRWWSTTW